jgi:hypothetical protein
MGCPTFSPPLRVRDAGAPTDFIDPSSTFLTQTEL